MASLNLSTFATLYMYGYKNVYELGPLVAIEKSKLEFERRRDAITDLRAFSAYVVESRRPCAASAV